MNKEEFIKRRGEVAYEKMLQRNRDWNAEHPKNRKVIQKKWAAQHRDKINGKSGVWRAANPDKVKVHNQEMSRKGGKYYAKKLEYRRVGIQVNETKSEISTNYNIAPSKKQRQTVYYITNGFQAP